MTDQPISIHYQQMEEWLNDRKSLLGKQHKREFAALLTLAPKLVQQVQYDIPAIQKRTKKCSGSIEECHRVYDDVDRVVASTQEKRRKLLSEYELGAGADDSAALQVALDRRIKESQRRLTAELLGFAQEHLPSFKDGYNGVVQKTMGGEDDASADGFARHFPWLERLVSERALPVARDTAGAAANAGGEEEEEDAPPPQIDWGDSDTAAADLSGGTGGAIEPEEAANVVEIRWDAAEEEAAELAAVQGSAADGAVAVTSNTENEIGEEEAAAVTLPSANGKFLSLDVSRTRDRTNLLTELHGCKCFAGERLEAKDERFLAFHLAVGALISSLTSSIEAEFVRMYTNFRERDMFEERVACFDRTISTAQTRKASHQAKCSESKAELELLEPQLQTLLDLTRANRDQCLEYLSAIFPGRKVMIVGDINKYI